MTALSKTLDHWRAGASDWLQAQIQERWADIGLRTKMSAMVTIGLIGLVAAFALVGINAARQATHRVLNERVMVARLSATNLDSSLEHLESILTMLAYQQSMSDLKISFTERQSATDRISELDHGLYLLDQNGKPLAWTLGSKETAPTRELIPQINWSQIDAVRRALSGQGFSFSLFPPGQIPAANLGVVAVPVYGAKGMPVGSVVALVDLTSEEFLPLERPFNLGETGMVNVVDAGGNVVISSNLEMAKASEKQDGVISAFFVAGEPGVETCLGCFGEDTLEARDEVIAFAPLTQMPWGVVVRQKAEEVFAPVRGLMLQNLIMGLVVIAGALGLVWVTTNSVITPVQMLTEATERIAEGELDSPLECVFAPHSTNKLPRMDEVGQLAQSFQYMCAQLKQSMDEIQSLNRELDARVQERTTEALAAQLEAQAARDDLRAIIDSMSDELVVIGVDDHRIQQVNRAAQLRHGKTESLIGKPCNSLSHYNQGCHPPDGDCPISQVLETEESVKVTHRHPCPDTGADCYVDVVASPMRDASGKITRIVELSRDVTQERQTAESLLRRNQQLSMLNAIANTVNQSLDIGEILERALEQIIRLTDIDVGAIFLREDSLGNLELVACQGLSKRSAALVSDLGMLDGACGGVIERKQVVIVPDITRHRGKRARSLQKENLSTLVHVPLIAKGYALGSMCVGTRQHREFNPKEEELLSAIGNQIAVAIENARLYAEVQHKEKVRGELFKKAINAQEEERKRIARELHDETSQTLAALLFAAEEGMDTGDIAEIKSGLERMHTLAQHTLDGVHKLIFDLRPSMLDHLGLVPAVRQLAKSRLEPKGVRVNVEELTPGQRLPSTVETALFRVVQEAIANIARHAAARNVWILIESNENGLAITIEDDGVGFELNEVIISQESWRGLGLLGMQERLELLSGALEISSSPGHGTQIKITIPTKHRSTVYA